MSFGWMFLVLGLLWLALLVILVVTIRHWMAEEVGPELDCDELKNDPQLVSTCRELSELAAKTKEASHG